ncbi:hypothetical protein ACLBWT_13075 [Paenibacillus sp. D51F]
MLELETGKASMEISDRGMGFHYDKKQSGRYSIGLTSIRERTEMAGGELEVFSQPRAGTTVKASFIIVKST